MVVYTYSISISFPKGINSAKLADEIHASSITIALDHISSEGDELSIVFKTDLSSSELDLLNNSIIPNHDYTPSTNGPAEVNVTNTAFVTEKPQEIGDRIWCYSHDFCDRTTWFNSAIRVIDEQIGIGDGTKTVFHLANTFAIDVTHGKITDEHTIVPTTAQGGNSYAIEVKVNGIIVLEREFGEADGSYTVDYRAGTITFFTAPTNGAIVTASYFYSPEVTGRSSYHLYASPGKNILLTDVYVQVSKDLVMTDSIMTGIYIPDQNGQCYLYPPSQTIWKRIRDLINYSDSVSPLIPFGLGGSPRGLNNNTMIFWIQYSSPVKLQGNYGMYLKFWTAHDREFTGEFATVSCFGIAENAS